MILDSIIAEFHRYKGLAEGAMQQISDESLTRVVGDDNNSVAIIVKHIAGNLKSRFTDFLTSDGEKPWRKRDSEFEAPDTSRQELMARWQAGWQVLMSTLDELTDDDLKRTITIRGTEFTVIAALHRALSHISYHAGQIVFICRYITGDEWESLSIPRGGTVAYNKNPDRERPEMPK